MDRPVHISIVSPVYMGAAMVDELVRRAGQAAAKLTENYEIILVDDRSPDDSWKKITENCQRDKRVKGLRLSRNFGQHPAILAGLQRCRGEWIVVMDCDLQDVPEEIPKLYARAREGHDLVLALRNNRQDGFLKRSFSRLFYSLLSYLTGIKHDARIANFGIYHHKVTDAILKMPEYNRYFPVMVRWVGFDAAHLEVTHGKRESGRSGYSFRKYFQLALQIVLSFSEKPLYLMIKLGLGISLLSFLFGLFVIFRWYTHHVSVQGWASIMASVWFLGGLIISTLGVVGLYIGKTFEQVRHRPVFVADQELNLHE